MSATPGRSRGRGTRTLLKVGGGVCVPRLSEGRGGFRLFTEGDDLYAAMLMGIGVARRAVRSESFIFAADPVGWGFARALADRARAGVDVRFHFDARGGAFRPSRELYEELVTAGVKLRWYHPWHWRHPSSYFRRNHRKLLVIDETEAFLGGFNVRLFVNHELVLFARDRGLGGALRAQYQRDLDDAEEVRPAVWHARRWRERGVEAVGRAVRRLL